MPAASPRLQRLRCAGRAVGAATSPRGGWRSTGADVPRPEPSFPAGTAIAVLAADGAVLGGVVDDAAAGALAAARGALGSVTSLRLATSHLGAAGAATAAAAEPPAHFALLPSIVGPTT